MKNLAAAVLTAAIPLILNGQVFADQKDAQAFRPKRPVTVTSDRMEADKNRGVVVFKGNVAAVEDFTLCADELTINYGVGNDVNEMVANGNVRIFQDGKTSSSDSAVYKRAERTISLSGHSQVEQCSDTVKGDRITVHLDDNNAFVEGSGGQRVRAVITPGKNCGQSDSMAKSREEAVKTPVKVTGDEALCKRAR